MLKRLTSRIMPRTTIDIDAAVLRELKKRQRREGKSLGQLVSELLAASLREEHEPPPEPFAWVAKSMRPLVDLEDKDAVYRILDGR
jgi:hypothetical protein